MVYKSTRDSGVAVSAAQAISQGISKDGGLFVPAEFPSITSDDLQLLAGCGYVERASFVLSRFLTDFSAEEIDACTKAAYTADKFGSADTAPLHALGNDVHVLELWHGPTCAFKDMALQILPHLMRVSAEKKAGGKKIVILVATSGDTGKAALEGFKDADNTEILVFYPEDGVSRMQKLQMTTQEGKNVAVCAIRGNFDDAQTGVKTIFGDKAMAQKLEDSHMMFSSANSINWGRLVPQIVYYISAYCDLLKTGGVKMGEAVNVVVPTGNFGNILAAYYARKMGLPIAKLVCASNTNRVLTDFIRTGVYDRNREFHTTTSPSMDILISSNLERLLYDLSGCDDGEIRRLMKELAETGRYEVSPAMKAKIQELFAAAWCDDIKTGETIAETYNASGYLLDPHTAVGMYALNAYRQTTGDKTPVVLASTANPYKFCSSVLAALGENIGDADEFAQVRQLHVKTGCPVPAPINDLQGKQPRFTQVCDREDMQQVIMNMLHLT